MLHRCLIINLLLLGQSLGTEAQLSDSVTISLIGLRPYGHQQLEPYGDSSNWPWWNPEGIRLAQAPYTRTTRTTQPNTFLCIAGISSNRDLSLKAIGPYDQDRVLRIPRVIDTALDANSLRVFDIQCRPKQEVVDITMMVGTQAWEVVENWPGSERGDPYSYSLGSSAGLVGRYPIERGNNLVAEACHTMLDMATRLVLFTKDGDMLEGKREFGGAGQGIVRDVYWFKDITRKDVDHLEFQRRAYNYVATFRNVSLKPGHMTDVQIECTEAGSLKNKPFPPFDDLGITLDPNRLQDRALLIVFVDMNQRPSRHMIKQLQTQADQGSLDQINVLIIQTEAAPGQVLPRWANLKHEQVDFTQPQRIGDAGRKAWNIKSLPWTVLCNQQGIVCDEGFRIEKIKDLIASLPEPGS